MRDTKEISSLTNLPRRQPEIGTYATAKSQNVN